MKDFFLLLKRFHNKSILYLLFFKSESFKFNINFFSFLFFFAQSVTQLKCVLLLMLLFLIALPVSLYPPSPINRSPRSPFCFLFHSLRLPQSSLGHNVINIIALVPELTCVIHTLMSVSSSTFENTFVSHHIQTFGASCLSLLPDRT